MVKKDEMADPDSCLNKATDDEPIFVLLGRDPAFAATIRFWMAERISLGKNKPGDRQIHSAAYIAMSVSPIHG